MDGCLPGNPSTMHVFSHGMTYANWRMRTGSRRWHLNFLACFILILTFLHTGRSLKVDTDILHLGGHPRRQLRQQEELPQNGSAVRNGLTEALQTNIKELILDPFECNGGVCEGRPKCALIIYPGGFLFPSNYLDLAMELQRKANATIELWVYIVPIDWSLNFAEPEVDPVDTAVGNLTARGFVPDIKAYGNTTRYENVFLAGHSAGAVPVLTTEWKSARGVIMMGAYMVPLPGQISSSSQFPLPILQILGELDGQVRITQLAYAATEMVEVALRTGLRYAVSKAPVVIVEGMNHIQFSNASARFQFGDLEPEIALASVLESAATSIVAFMGVNLANVSVEAGEVHRLTLGNATKAAVDMLSPYAIAVGYGNLSAAYEVAISGDRQEGIALSGGLVNYGVWGEQIGNDMDARMQVAHPGEARVAEAFCSKAQGELLRPLEGIDVKVLATVHTTLEYFQRSRPSFERLADGGILVTPSCLIYRRNMVDGTSPMVGIASQYWMKLASCESIASLVQVSSNISDPMQACAASNFSATGLNNAALEEALLRSTGRAKQRFEARGRPVKFVPQEQCGDVPCSDVNPFVWASTQLALSVEIDPKNGSVAVVKVPTLIVEEVVHVKAFSVGRAMEYILVDSLQFPDQLA